MGRATLMPQRKGQHYLHARIPGGMKLTETEALKIAVIPLTCRRNGKQPLRKWTLAVLMLHQPFAKHRLPNPRNLLLFAATPWSLERAPKTNKYLQTLRPNRGSRHLRHRRDRDSCHLARAMQDPMRRVPRQVWRDLGSGYNLVSRPRPQLMHPYSGQGPTSLLVMPGAMQPAR